MAQQQPLILPRVAAKGRSYPRRLHSHFGVNIQVLPFSDISLVFGPCSLLLKIPRVRCVSGLRRIRQPLKLTGNTLPFRLVMALASSLSLLFSGDWYLSCCFSVVLRMGGKTVRKAEMHIVHKNVFCKTDFTVVKWHTAQRYPHLQIF